MALLHPWLESGLRSLVIPAALIAGSALAVPVDAGSLTVSRTVSAEHQAAASAYWTRSRIAAARPMTLPRDTGPAEVVTPDGPRSAEPMGVSAPGRPAPNAGRVARAAYPHDWAAVDEDPELDEPFSREDGAVPQHPMDVQTGTAGVFTSYDVNTNAALWQIAPHRWSGRLAFTVPGGTATCSATVISGNNIVTAAHCVYDTASNKWYANWVFAPAYRSGSAPYGTFPVRTCSVLSAYVNQVAPYQINTWTRHDVAVCTLNTNSAAQTVNAAVGWAGRLWNAGNTQLVFNSGYPAYTYADTLIGNGPAQYLRSCTAETFLQTTETLGSGCSWGRGISGGGWLVNYKPFVQSGMVNSVNSGGYLGVPNIYGARFNSNNIVPLCNARGC
jgi:hypothetical protein